MTAAIPQAATDALAGSQAAAFNPQHQAALTQMLSGQPNNPFLQQAIEAAQAPTAMALNREVGRRIPGAFAAAGHNLGGGGSSPYQRALGEASFLGGRALGDIATNMSFGAYNLAQQMQQQGVQLSQQDMQNMLQNAQLQFMPQAIGQQGIQNAIQTGQAGIQNLLNAFNIAQQMPVSQFQPTSVAQSTSQSTSSGQQAPGQPNLLGGLFGNQGMIPWFMGNQNLQANAGATA